jgi:hypothetical protein
VKSVQIKGSTYHFLSNTFNYKKIAPVSVIWGHKIFGISKATPSRLKQAARKKQFIELKKNFGEVIPNKKLMELVLEYNDNANNIVFYKGEYRLQLIDTNYPLLYIIKLTNLKT